MVFISKIDARMYEVKKGIGFEFKATVVMNFSEYYEILWHLGLNNLV